MSQAELLSPASISPSVSLHSGRPATTSLEVAKFFGKRHTDVLRDVNNFSANCPKEFSQRNFASAEYTDEQGKPRPMFILYRDGFMLLVMGYTGKKALAMKLAYIEAFNRMEAELAARRQTALSAAPGPDASLTLSTTEDRKPLRALVGSWAQVSGLPFAACWTQLKAAFRLSDIRDLPQEWIPDALAWVQGKIDSIHSGNFREIPEIPSSMQRRMQDMHDFEKRFCDFAYETRSQFSEIEREYRMLTHGVFPDMLRMVPAIDQSAIRRLTDALESQSYSAYQMINDGLSIMRMSIISAKAAIRTLKNMD